MNPASTTQSFWTFSRNNVREAVRLYFAPIRQIVRWTRSRITEQSVTMERIEISRRELEKLQERLREMSEHSSLVSRDYRVPSSNDPTKWSRDYGTTDFDERLNWFLERKANLRETDMLLDEETIRRYFSVLTDKELRILLQFIQDSARDESLSPMRQTTENWKLSHMKHDFYAWQLQRMDRMIYLIFLMIHSTLEITEHSTSGSPESVRPHSEG